MVLKNDETLTRVNENIELIQKKSGLTFGTDAYLLSAYTKPKVKGVACDFGAGTGIISLLCAARGRFGKIYAVEVQEEFADVICRNVTHNGFEDKIEVVQGDVRELKLEADVVFTNPPYMKSGNGRANQADAKNIARHELNGDIGEFCRAASRVLKYGGYFYCVYRPDRLCDLICAMRENDVEAKRITFVYPTKDHKPCLVLVEGKKGGGSSAFVTPPLILSEGGKDTEDIKYIYEKGEFGDKFQRQ